LANKESDLKKKTSDYLFDLQEDDSEENKKEFINIQLDKMSEEDDDDQHNQQAFEQIISSGGNAGEGKVK
jgi:hypothetical protein